MDIISKIEITAIGKNSIITFSQLSAVRGWYMVTCKSSKKWRKAPTKILLKVIRVTENINPIHVA